MVLDHNPLDTITESDLQALIAGGVAERKTRDYKQTLPGGNDEQRKEFLADVSSFANAAGGDLLFGIEEDKGVPVNIVGVDVTDPDALKLALENSVQNGLRPRLVGVETAVVPLVSLGSDKAVVIMRIRRSFAAPHMIWFKQSGRFFTRDSAGKHQLDVDELRAAFARSATFAERLRDFRRERISDVVSGEMPVALEPGAKLLLHIVPFTAFDLGAAGRHDLANLDSDPNLRRRLDPIGLPATNSRHVFEGYRTVNHQTDHEFGGYTLIYRNGSIEAVDANLLRSKYRGSKSDVIPGDWLKASLVKAVPRYLEVQQALGVEPPFAVLLTLVGVRGFYMDAKKATSDYYNRNSRNVLDVAEVLVEQHNVTEQTASTLLRPIFDAIWNATGYARSPNYDEHGVWLKQVVVSN